MIPPLLLLETVMRLNGLIGGAFVAELPTMGVRLDPVVIARVAAADCLRGKGEIVFRVTRDGRPYADQARVFTIAPKDRSMPSAFARELCREGLKIVEPAA